MSYAPLTVTPIHLLPDSMGVACTHSRSRFSLNAFWSLLQASEVPKPLTSASVARFFKALTHCEPIASSQVPRLLWVSFSGKVTLSETSLKKTAQAPMPVRFLSAEHRNRSFGCIFSLRRFCQEHPRSRTPQREWMRRLEYGRGRSNGMICRQLYILRTCQRRWSGNQLLGKGSSWASTAVFKRAVAVIVAMMRFMI
jgi:hypothetical protein